MAGTLHVFRRRVANGPEVYQVNYTVVSKTYAKVLEGRPALRDFLEVGAALEPSALDSLWHQIEDSGSATMSGIDISEQAASSLGMKEAPSDF